MENIAIYLQGIKNLSEYIVEKATGKTRKDYYNDLDLRFSLQFTLGKIGDFIITIRDISGVIYKNRTDINEQKRRFLFHERVDFHWTAYYHIRGFLTHSYF